MRTKRLTGLYQEERMWFYAAVTLLLIAVALYMYFVSASIAHVVMRKEVDKEILLIGSNVSTLEAEYIEAQHSVSAEIASLQGYTLTEEKIFIDRTQTPVAFLQP